jgi:hypothetical protein
MKVGIATTLSIAGVLAAGAAAFAVNSSVLGASSSISPTTSGTSAAVVNTVALPASVVEQSTNVQSSVLNNTTTTYQVGAAGSVVLDMRSGAIAVSNVLPAAGWSSEPAQVQPNGDVKVPFISSSTRIEFFARLVDGKVAVNVTSQPIAPPSTMKPAANPPQTNATSSDDDGEKEHERDNEKEREHDEDEDDD